MLRSKIIEVDFFKTRNLKYSVLFFTFKFNYLDLFNKKHLSLFIKIYSVHYNAIFSHKNHLSQPTFFFSGFETFFKIVFIKFVKTNREYFYGTS